MKEYLGDRKVLTLEANQALLVGEVLEGFTPSHVFKGKQFFKNVLRVMRNSGTYDFVPIISVSPYPEIKEGDTVSIEGSVYTHYKPDKYKSVKLYVMINKLRKVGAKTPHQNDIFIAGVMSRYVDPYLRRTPFGRTLCEFVIQKPHSIKDYTYNIYCIAWGKTAQYVNCLTRGQKIGLQGRFQSRDYVKCVAETNENISIRTYEISVMEMLPIKV